MLKKGGYLLAGMDNGINFAFDDTETNVEYTLPFNPLVCEEHRKSLGENGGVQFSHTIENLIGGLRLTPRLDNILLKDWCKSL